MRRCVSSPHTPSAAWVGSKAGAAGAGPAQPSRPGRLRAELPSVPRIGLPVERCLDQVSWACFGVEVGGLGGGFGHWAEQHVSWGDVQEEGGRGGR